MQVSSGCIVTQAPGHPEIARIVAPNPGPMTLEGTNTYLYGSDPCTVIDPGPDMPSHLDAVRAAAEERGGIGVVLLTHGHGDHADGAERLGVEVVLPGRRRGARRPARDRHARPRRRPRLPAHRRRRLLQRRPRARRGLDLRPARRRLARRLHGLAAPHAGRADRADLPRPRALDHRPGGEAGRVRRAPRDARAPPARRPRARRALPRGPARRGLGRRPRPSSAPPPRW